MQDLWGNTDSHPHSPPYIALAAWLQATGPQAAREGGLVGEKSQGPHGALLWGTGAGAAPGPQDKIPCTLKMVVLGHVGIFWCRDEKLAVNTWGCQFGGGTRRGEVPCRESSRAADEGDGEHKPS